MTNAPTLAGRRGHPGRGVHVAHPCTGQMDAQTTRIGEDDVIRGPGRVGAIRKHSTAWLAARCIVSDIQTKSVPIGTR